MEKMYRIPSSLNDEAGFVGCYTIKDMIIIISLFAISFLAALVINFVPILFVPVLYSVLRFKYNGYIIFYWCRIACRFIFGSKHNSYILFERKRRK